MKKILFILVFLISLGASAQIAYFPTVDSLRRFTDRYIRNSAIEAFTNLRLNTTIKGIEQFLDSARLVWGGGLPDTLYAYRSSDSVYFKIGVAGTPVYMYKDSVGAGGGGGAGDVVGPSSSTNNQFVQFDLATGKLLKAYTGTGYPKTTSGVPTSVTTIPNADIVTFKPYGPERTWQTLFEMSTFSLADFRTQGTAVLSLSGERYLNITATTEDYTPRVVFKPEWATGSNRWVFEGIYKITAFGSPSNWFGPGIQSLVAHDGADFSYIWFTGVGAGGGGNSFFIDGAGNIIQNAGAGPSKSLNDRMYFKMERTDSSLVYTITNLNTTTTQTSTYSFPANNSQVLPNVGNWILMMNAQGGTMQLQYLKVSMPETISSNVFIVGNSKTVNPVTTFNSRYPYTLNATYPTVTFSAGTAERLFPDIFYKRLELTNRNSEYVLLADLISNDHRASATEDQIIDRINTIESYWAGGGTKVYWMLFPEDTTAGSGLNGYTKWHNWMLANRTANYINTWAALRTSGSDNRLANAYDNGDGVHLNKAGHDLVASTIVSSGLLATISINRRVQLRASDNNIRIAGDSIYTPYKWSRVANNLVRVDADYNLTRSVIDDNGTTATFSNTLQPTLPAATSTFRALFSGPVGIFSNLGQLNIYDRGSPNNSHYKYVDNNILRFGYNLGGSSNFDYTSVSGEGKWRISSGALGTYKSTFSIQQNYSYNWTTDLDGFGLNVDSSTYTFTSSTALGDASTVAFNPSTWVAAGATSFPWASTVEVMGPAIASTNVTFTNGPLAFRVRTGNSLFGGNISIPVSGYVNVGNTFGSGGYGFRDNGGTMEAKNSGDSWKPIATGTVSSGQYTPTLTHVTNVDASTAFQCHWMRIGNVVHVSGKVSIDPTSATTLTQLGFTLPFASGFSTDGEAGGTFATAAGDVGIILGDGANTRVEFQVTPAGAGNVTYWFTFTYFLTPP